MGNKQPLKSVYVAHQGPFPLRCAVNREALHRRGVGPIDPQPGCIPSLQQNWVRGLQQNCVPVQSAQLGWACQEISNQLWGAEIKPINLGQ